MIFVDTSVWVDFFRGTDPELMGRLRALLDEREVALAAPVRLELLSGAGRRHFAALQAALEALWLIYPVPSTWALVEEWVAKAARAGERFGVGDLLIGGLAAERRAPLWSLDKDFSRMARLGFVELYDASRGPGGTAR